MSITAANLLVKIGADDKGAEAKLGHISSKVKETGGFFKNALSNAMGFAMGAGAVNLMGDAVNLVKDNLGQMIDAGKEANSVNAQTAAVLRSTHAGAGMTAQAIGDLSEKYRDMSGVDDTVIQQAENMLLTFTNIHKDVFPQTTKTVLDMATAMNGGLVPSQTQVQQTAIQVGKALGDPIKGYTALQRVGVTFTAQQVAQMKAMEASGNMAGAQSIILKELQKEFGGSAAAAGKANGGIAILTAQLDTMKQNIGQAVIPIITAMLKALQPLTAALADHLPGALKVVSGFFTGTLMPALNQFLPVVREVWAMAQTLANTFMTALAPAFKTIGTSIDDTHKPANLVVEIMGKLTGVFQQALPIVKQLGNWFATVGIPAFRQFGEFIEKNVLPTLLQVGQFIATTVLPALGQLANWVVTKVVPAAEQLFKWFSAHVLPILEKVVSIVVADVLPTLESMANTVMQKLVPAIEKLWNKISPVLIPVLQLLGGIIKNVVGPAFNLVITIIGKVIDIIATIIGKIGDLMGWFGNLKDKIGSTIGDILGKIGQFKDNFLKTFGDLPGKLFDMGKNLIQKLIDGITGMASNLQREAGKAIRGALSNIPGVGGLLSHLPHFASGGTMGTSGIAVVGEQGPELVKLPAGAQVYSASQTAGMFSHAAPTIGRGTQPVHIHVNIAGQDVAQVLMPDITEAIRSATGSRMF